MSYFAHLMAQDSKNAGIQTYYDMVQFQLDWMSKLLGLKLLGEGRHRVTYRLNETTVWKFPLSKAGAFDNLREAEIYKETQGTDGDFRYAKCSVFLLWNLPILEMEYVEPSWSSDLPGWTNFIDCQQVGYNKDGILVAYDFAG